MTEGVVSLEGASPDARALSAGGLYLAPNLSSAWISLALCPVWIQYDKSLESGATSTHLFAYAAEGAGGGVFPEETLE